MPPMFVSTPALNILSLPLATMYGLSYLHTIIARKVKHYLLKLKVSQYNSSVNCAGSVSVGNWIRVVVLPERKPNFCITISDF